MRKKIRKIAACVMAAAIVTAGGAMYYVSAKDNTETPGVYKEVTVSYDTLTKGVSESGNASIGSITQTFELDTSYINTMISETLEVEKVYIAAGQVVSEGDALYKLTDESVASFRRILSDAVSECSLSLANAVMERDTKLTEAEASLAGNRLLGENAQAVYNSAITDLEAKIRDAEEAIEDAAQTRQEYVEEIAELEEKIEGEANAEKVADYQEEIEALNKKIARIDNNAAKLESNLEKAKRNLESGTVVAQAEYNESMLTYSNADKLYEIEVSGMDDEVEECRENLEAAQEVLTEFDELVQNGIIYSQYTGTVMSAGLSQGDEFSTYIELAQFVDTQAVTVTVSVSEEDVADITLGRDAKVVFAAYPDVRYDAVVTAIDTSYSSNSSTVSYNITVTLEGEVSAIYSGMTATVTFVEDEVENVLCISNKAIITEAEASYVYVKQEDGTFVKTEITTGFTDGVMYEVVSGLSEGDVVKIESKVSGS